MLLKKVIKWFLWHIFIPSRDDYDVHGLGLDKDVIVLKGDDNRIVRRNTELIQNVS